jgi:hypothetical protein
MIVLLTTVSSAFHSFWVNSITNNSMKWLSTFNNTSTIHSQDK